MDGGPSIYVHGDDGFLLTFLQSTVLTVLPAVNLQPEWIRILLLLLLLLMMMERFNIVNSLHRFTITINPGTWSYLNYIDRLSIISVQLAVLVSANEEVEAEKVE